MHVMRPVQTPFGWWNLDQLKATPLVTNQQHTQMTTTAIDNKSGQIVRKPKRQSFHPIAFSGMIKAGASTLNRKKEN